MKHAPIRAAGIAGLALVAALGSCGRHRGGSGSGGGPNLGPTPPTKFWASPVLLDSEDLGYAEAPQVAIDAAGNAIAVWDQSNGAHVNIWSNRYTAGGAWGSAQLIETDDTGDAKEPHAGFDAAGNAVAVWQQFDGITDSIYSSRYVAGTGWGTMPGVIETGNDLNGAGAPQIAVDPAGNAVAVWGQYTGARSDIWANRYVTGTGWGTAELVEHDDAGDMFGARVAVDPAGNATAVWIQRDGASLLNAWTNRYGVGTGWGTAQLLETDDTGDVDFPVVAVDPAGNAVAVWDQSDGTRFNIWANRYVVGAGWGTAEMIEYYDAGDALIPAVAVDSNGDAIAIWYQDDVVRVNLYWNRFVPGTGWGAAQLFSDDTGDASDPHVAFDSHGNAIAVWDQYDGARFNVWARRYDPGADGWDAPILIEHDDTHDAFAYQVAVNAEGYAVAVWTQNGGTWDNIWANVYR